MKALLITCFSLTLFTLTGTTVAFNAYNTSPTTTVDNTSPASTNSPEGGNIDLDGNFLPPNTPYLQPNRIAEVKCVNRCGDQFDLPSVGTYKPGHVTKAVAKSEQYQQRCLKACLRQH